MTLDYFKTANSAATEVPASCDGDAEAFLMNGGECLYRFDDVVLTGIEKEKTAKERAVGFLLEFNSMEKCKD